MDRKIEEQVKQRIIATELATKLETTRETARQMKADGVPFASIAKYTGLSLEDIAAL